MSKPRDIFRCRARERRHRLTQDAKPQPESSGAVGNESWNYRSPSPEPSKARRKVAALWGLIGSLFS